MMAASCRVVLVACCSCIHSTKAGTQILITSELTFNPSVMSAAVCLCQVFLSSIQWSSLHNACSAPALLTGCSMTSNVVMKWSMTPQSYNGMASCCCPPCTNCHYNLTSLQVELYWHEHLLQGSGIPVSDRPPDRAPLQATPTGA